MDAAMVNRVLRTAEEAGYIDEEQSAQLAGLFIAESMLAGQRAGELRELGARLNEKDADEPV